MSFYETNAWLRLHLEQMYQLELFKTPAAEALRFLDKFSALSTRQTVTADPIMTDALVQQYGLVEDDLMLLGSILLGDGDADIRYHGKKLVLTLSRCGMMQATIRVVAEAVRQAKKNPRALQVAETQHARQHLAKAANEKLNYRVMVLEGKVARLLGDEERAIQLWTDAMAEAVKEAEAAEATAARAREIGITTPVAPDPFELSSPWIELMQIHWQRTKFQGKDEMAQCEWAMKIGCDQDDPTSHYYASDLLKQFDSQGSHLGSSDWLYHITKAASSGHPKAAYELGVFYAESGWKYIEDEPPDHVKPTPFDSYPAPKSTPRNGSLWERLKSLLWNDSRAEVKPHESLFHNAVFPETALKRHDLAHMWLGVASTYLYAPALLFHARLYLSKDLWAGADAPKSALELSSERYTFASKEDFERGIPLDKPTQQAAKDPPNPIYRPDQAKLCLKEVFFAHKAASHADEASKVYQKKLRAGLDAAVLDEDDIMQEAHFQKFGPNIHKWFRFPEVREMYEDQIDDLHRQAKEICDEHGWNLYDSENALIYKANIGKERKQVQTG